MKALQFEASALAVVAVAFAAAGLFGPFPLITRGVLVFGSALVFCASAFLWSAK